MSVIGLILVQFLVFLSSGFKSPLGPLLCFITSQKHAYIILTPLNPTFIYSKTGVYKGIHHFSYICSKSIDCGYSLEPHRRAVLTSTHNLCFEQKFEKYLNFLSDFFQFLEVKFS